MLILAREEVVAALLGLMVEVSGFEPRFTRTDQSAEDAVKGAHRIWPNSQELTLPANVLGRSANPDSCHQTEERSIGRYGVDLRADVEDLPKHFCDPTE